MTTQQISDLLFNNFQEEVAESTEEPWATVSEEGHGLGNFNTNRIGDVLQIRHIPSGKRFVVRVTEFEEFHAW